VVVQDAYELYLIDDAGGRRFEPFACDGPIELMRALRERLDAEGLAAIEVRQGDRHVFTLER
jgi:hypothetical protein